MRGLPCVIPLLIGLCLLAACGIKGPPKPPRPKSPPQTSELTPRPQEAQTLAFSTRIIATP